MPYITQLLLHNNDRELFEQPKAHTQEKKTTETSKFLCQTAGIDT
jgi:hypothetical protein